MVNKSRRKTRQKRRTCRWKKYGGVLSDELIPDLPLTTSIFWTKTVKDSKQAKELCLKQTYTDLIPSSKISKYSDAYYRKRAFEYFFDKYGKTEDKTEFTEHFFCNDMKYINDVFDEDPDDTTYLKNSSYAPIDLVEYPSYISSRSRKNLHKKVLQIKEYEKSKTQNPNSRNPSLPEVDW